jgi:hypothetical protein
MGIKYIILYLVGCVYIVQDREKLRAVVKTAMNLVIS